MCRHQHFNNRTDAPARYFEITTLPPMKLMGSRVIENHPESQGSARPGGPEFRAASAPDRDI